MRICGKFGFWGLILMLVALLALLLAVAYAATTLTARLEVKANSRFVNALDLSSPADLVALDLTQNFTAGAGDNQVNRIFHDTRNLGAGANESLDLAGVLTNAFGETVTFTTVKALVVKNPSTTQTLSIGGGGVNSFINWVADATDIVKVPPGGMLVLTAPLAGFAVTADTGDLLKILNSGGAAVDYKIWIVGQYTAP